MNVDRECRGKEGVGGRSRATELSCFIYKINKVSVQFHIACNLFPYFDGVIDVFIINSRGNYVFDGFFNYVSSRSFRSTCVIVIPSCVSDNV